MGSKISIDKLADQVMAGLMEYSSVTADEMKTAVKKAATTVRKEIQAKAPKRTGKYAKSWAIKRSSESSTKLTMTVHSKNRYQLAHLLEFGHAKRGGGRVQGSAHIAPAEKAGVQQLESDIERSLRRG